MFCYCEDVIGEVLVANCMEGENKADIFVEGQAMVISVSLLTRRFSFEVARVKSQLGKGWLFLQATGNL